MELLFCHHRLMPYTLYIFMNMKKMNIFMSQCDF